jgi:ribokinase
MILVAGSANLDFVVSASHIPAPGETVLGQRFQTFPGGKGANQAVACARAGGADTHMLLAIGPDDYAKLALHTVAGTEPTGCAFICVSDDGENAITVAPGANMQLQSQHLLEHLPGLVGVSHLLLQLETPMATVEAYAQHAKQLGVQVVLNAAPAQGLSDTLLANLDVLVVNEGELFEVAAGKLGQRPDSMEQALQALNVPTVVVTLGAQGSCAWVGGQRIDQHAFKVAVQDTTGAGDTFCGALTAALAKGDTMAQALRVASAASALACTVLGAQSSIPSAQAVADFLEQ